MRANNLYRQIVALMIAFGCVFMGCQCHSDGQGGVLIRGDWALELNHTPPIAAHECSEKCEDKCREKREKKGLCSLLAYESDEAPKERRLGNGLLDRDKSESKKSNSTTAPPFPELPSGQKTPPAQLLQPKQDASPEKSEENEKKSDEQAKSVILAFSVCQHRPLCPPLLQQQTGQLIPTCVAQKQGNAILGINPLTGQIVRNPDYKIAQMANASALENGTDSKETTENNSIGTINVVVSPNSSVQQPIYGLPNGVTITNNAYQPQTGFGNPAVKKETGNDGTRAGMSVPTLHSVPTRPVFQSRM